MALLLRSHQRASLSAAAIASVAHFLTILFWLRTEAGWDFGLFNALLLISWLLATETTITCLLHRPMGRFAETFWLMAVLALLLRGLFPTSGAVLSELSFGLALHIVSSMLAFSLLTIAAFLALWLALLDWQLRHPKEARIDFSAPPLEVLERLFFRLVSVGFLLLTLALGSGFLFVEDLFGQHLAHKTFFSLLAWTLFGGLLYGRWRCGWRGKTAVRWSLAGLTALFFAYFVTKWVLEVLLR